MTQSEMVELVDQIRFYDYVFRIIPEGDQWNRCYLQASFVEPDIVTGKDEIQKTRKWSLSEHMTKSEFVQTIFKCCMTSMEHRTREHFRYKGRAVFSPHFDVDALWDLSKSGGFDYREDS